MAWTESDKDKLNLMFQVASIRKSLILENNRLEESARLVKDLNGDLSVALLRLQSAFGGEVPDAVIEALGI